MTDDDEAARPRPIQEAIRRHPVLAWLLALGLLAGAVWGINRATEDKGAQKRVIQETVWKLTCDENPSSPVCSCVTP